MTSRTILPFPVMGLPQTIGDTSIRSTGPISSFLHQLGAITSLRQRAGEL
jgi:hypothetical protein